MLTSNRHQQLDSALRTKYNTLTPAEAKKFLVGAPTLPGTNQAVSGQQLSKQQQLFNLPRQPPLRTASVLHKPRAPPIVVTNLDTTIDQIDSRSLCSGGPNYHNAFGSDRSLATANSDHHNANKQQQQQQQQQHFTDSADDKSASILRSTSIRTSSVYPQGRDCRRHTINYGRASMLNSRSSLYSRNTEFPPSPDQHHQYFSQHQRRAHASSGLNESISNLSFKSSLDTTDCSHEPYRLQTMSVDLGHQYYNITTGTSPAANTQSTTTTIKPQHYDPMLRAPTIGRLKYNTMSSTSSRMFSDESYSSCRSDISSARSCNATPTKFYNTASVASSNINRGGAGLNNGHNQIDKRKPPTSDSKVSLSSSTYNKMFQSPFANFKKLFRSMPRPFANGGIAGAVGSKTATATSTAGANISSLDSQLSNTSVSNNYASCRRQLKLDNSCQSDVSLGDISISDSISQISLNKSQSPPVCPPPPGELKSMCYMESSVNYSNYDEFTRARNERLATRQQVVGTKLSGQNGFASLITGQGGDKQQQQASSTNDHNEPDSWQLTSLPVYYERNLTTVFEEKQASCDNASGEQLRNNKDNKCADMDLGQQQHMIKPPLNFDDNGLKQSTGGAVEGDLGDNDNESSTFGKRHHSDSSKTDSLSRSTTSSATADSVLDYQQHKQNQQAYEALPPATPYRFSFAQPLASNPANDQVLKNLGLPPRMPTVAGQTMPATGAISENSRLDNSSSGNSSNCSSQLNGINCDRPNSLETYSDDKNSYSDESTTGFNNLNGLSSNSNDADVTILSETSTIQGDTGITYYANKCSELERTVATLKNKLINKEKELTDLQLGQLNNDYTIERLKKQVNKLEKENAQLRTIVANNKS